MNKKSFTLELKRVKIANLNIVNGGKYDPVLHHSRLIDSCANTAVPDTTCYTCETKCCPTTISTSEANSISQTQSLIDC